MNYLWELINTGYLLLQFFDKDNDGSLSIEEFRTANRELGNLLTDEEIKEFVSLVDVTHDGHVEVPPRAPYAYPTKTVCLTQCLVYIEGLLSLSTYCLTCCCSVFQYEELLASLTTQYNLLEEKANSWQSRSNHSISTTGEEGAANFEDELRQMERCEQYSPSPQNSESELNSPTLEMGMARGTHGLPSSSGSCLGLGFPLPGSPSDWTSDHQQIHPDTSQTPCISGVAVEKAARHLSLDSRLDSSHTPKM